MAANYAYREAARVDEQYRRNRERLSAYRLRKAAYNHSRLKGQEPPATVLLFPYPVRVRA